MWLPAAIVNTKLLDLLQLISSKTWPESDMATLYDSHTQRGRDTTERKTGRNIFQGLLDWFPVALLCFHVVTVPQI